MDIPDAENHPRYNDQASCARENQEQLVLDNIVAFGFLKGILLLIVHVELLLIY